MKKLICIVGPTASGKSALALQLAEELDGEIICADSQTVKRDLDIGTAKPSKEHQQRVTHHMLDIIDPYDRFSAASFKQQAEKHIDSIYNRGKVPILVGGTGLYVDAVLYDFSFNPKASNRVRDDLNKKSAAELQQMVRETSLPMPNNKHNPRHLIRTIESSGQKPSKASVRPDVIEVGLDPGKKELQRRIEARVENMFTSGFLEEVAGVLRKYGQPPEKWDAIGYRMVVDALREGLSEEDMKQSIIIAHRQYAKRQRAWFKRNKGIVWFEQVGEAATFLEKQLSIY